MFGGIAIGLVSAVLQSTAYIFSRRFVMRHKSPFKLMIYSNLLQALFSLTIIAVLMPAVDFHWSLPVAAWLVAFVIFGSLGSFAFFRALRDIEASRLSSLMGLKLAVLTPLNILYVNTLPGIWQIVAIMLSIIAAVGMNFAGGALKLRGLCFLCITLFSYSITDIGAAELPRLVGVGRYSAFLATSLAYLACGAVTSLTWCKMKFEKECLLTALPYAVFWFSAMILLFMSFNLIGVLYGTIIQATRGLFSVILGWLLLKLGFERLEPPVSAGAWIRRLIMALLMIGAIVIYNIR